MPLPSGGNLYLDVSSNTPSQSAGGGVLRRPWAALVFDDRPHPYLGLAAAVRDKGTIASMELMSDRLVIRGPDDETVIPLDEEARVLVNWAGNRNRPRESTYVHVPFLALVIYYREYYDVLDKNMKKIILSEPEENRSETDKEYLALSARLRSVLEGENGMRPDEMRSIEKRMAAIREEYAADFEARVAELDKALARIT